MAPSIFVTPYSSIDTVSGLRDLIYLDVAKASSLLSQAELGLVQEIRASEEGGSDAVGTIGSSIPLLKAEVSGSLSERGSRSETRVLHHALLTRLEEVLADRALVTDIVKAEATRRTATALREAALDRPYIRSTGWIVLEDYARMNGQIEQFNQLAAFMRRCSQSTIESSEEYLVLKAQLLDQRSAAEQERDRERRKRALAEVKNTEKGLAAWVEQLVGAAAPGGIEDWLVQGIGHWIEAYHSGQIHLRLYPDEEVPDFHFLANLKRSAFVDDTIDNVLFAYGTRPNVQLSLVGLVTSAPRAEGHVFDPMAEYVSSEEPEGEADVRGFERGFRQAFAGLRGLETFSRFERFPNVTVYPIAVYRDVAT